VRGIHIWTITRFSILLRSRICARSSTNFIPNVTSSWTVRPLSPLWPSTINYNDARKTKRLCLSLYGGDGDDDEVEDKDDDDDDNIDNDVTWLLIVHADTVMKFSLYFAKFRRWMGRSENDCDCRIFGIMIQCLQLAVGLYNMSYIVLSLLHHFHRSLHERVRSRALKIVRLWSDVDASFSSFYLLSSIADQKCVDVQNWIFPPSGVTSHFGLPCKKIIRAPTP